MSENQSSTPPSDSQDVPFQNAADNVNRSPADDLPIGGEISRVADDEPSLAISGSLNPSNSEPDSDSWDSDSWEAVSLPGTLGGDSIAAIERPKTSDSTISSVSSEREDELLTLIHDLNECNDALLARTSQLEGALETTRLALETELEKAKATQAKMASQITAEQVAAQQAAQNAQQQVAQLVSRLDTAEQACNRQQLINENLQTELSNCQERVVQLEHECALTTQQHAAEAQARIQAETTSRDLRSRLQRQQRYTLQFKAALEKSLSVSTRPAGLEMSAEATQPVSFKEPVPMPKAQRIMPWAAGSVSDFQGIDPHLETLIRGVSKTAEAPAAGEASDPSTAADREAEAALWQDLARVMTNAPEPTTPTSDQKAVSEKTLSVKPVQELPEPADPVTTRSPQLNWQAGAKSAIGTATDKVAAQSQSNLSQPSPALSPDALKADDVKADDVRAEASAIAPAVASSFAAATGQLSDAEIGFTEPSPWGHPLPEQPEQPERNLAEPAADSATVSPPTGYLPVIDDTAAVSPLVKPTRSPKKLSSLSAVQLPTFEKAKAGNSSFQR
ncbi:MAG: hypothetical protein WBB01_11115 [Phormidesmis sp.]